MHRAFCWFISLVLLTFAGFGCTGEKSPPITTESLSRRIADDPNDWMALYMRGMTLMNNMDYDAAIADFDKAIAINFENSDLHMWVGRCWLAKKDFTKAFKNLDEAIRLDPRSSQAFAWRGKAWLTTGNFDKAIDDYSAAIKLNPKDRYNFTDRGRAWLAKRDVTNGLKDFESALELDPNSDIANRDVAWILATSPEAQFSDGPRAVKLAMKACVVSDWKYPELIQTLAAAHAECGQFQDAIKYQIQALNHPEFASEESTVAAMREIARQRLELYKQNKPYRQP